MRGTLDSALNPQSLWSTITKCLKLVFKQQTFCFSQRCGLEVWNQHVSLVKFWWRHYCWSVNGHPLAVVVERQQGLWSLSYKGTNSITGTHLCCVCAQSCLTLCDPTDCSPPGSFAHGSSRQEYWNELPFAILGDLLDPEIESVSLASPATAGRFFTTSATCEAPWHHLNLLTSKGSAAKYYNTVG